MNNLNEYEQFIYDTLRAKDHHGMLWLDLFNAWREKYGLELRTEYEAARIALLDAGVIWRQRGRDETQTYYGANY